MIRQLVGCLKENLSNIFPDSVKELVKDYEIICNFGSKFDISVDVERKIIKISNYSIEYIWAWSAHWILLYNYCHDEKLILSELISQWDDIKKKPQIKRSLLLLKLMSFNGSKPLNEQVPWIIKHFNPNEIKSSIVDSVNRVFNYVLMNMILHEIGHVKFDHRSDPNATTDNDNQKMEADADAFSYDQYIHILSPIADNFMKDFAWIGIVLSQLLIFNLSHLDRDYFKKYGNPCYRLDTAVAILDSQDSYGDDHSIYAFLSLVLWTCIRNDKIDFKANESISFKEQYSEIAIVLNNIVKEWNFYI